MIWKNSILLSKIRGDAPGAWGARHRAV